jgi:hypothetical protein
VPEEKLHRGGERVGEEEQEQEMGEMEMEMEMEDKDKKEVKESKQEGDESSQSESERAHVVQELDNEQERTGEKEGRMRTGAVGNTNERNSNSNVTGEKDLTPYQARATPPENLRAATASRPFPFDHTTTLPHHRNLPRDLYKAAS